jgi:uncharacterized protein (TIGR02569 family)
MSNDPTLAPSPNVLQAFGARGALQRLGRGQGVFATDDVVLKLVADEEEAIWIAEMQLTTEPRGFRLARPIASVSGCFVVDGWTAWTRVLGEHRLQGGPWRAVVALCARFHEALKDVPRPDFLDRRTHQFARADRIAWNEAQYPLAPRVRPIVEALASKLSPSRQPTQLIHGDFAGNVLFADALEPAVIDFSPYFRPASYAIALTVVDAVLWHGGSLELLAELAHLDDGRQMVARALIFRLAIDGLFAWDEPGTFWSAAITRDLSNACPLLDHVLR